MSATHIAELLAHVVTHALLLVVVDLAVLVLVNGFEELLALLFGETLDERLRVEVAAALTTGTTIATAAAATGKLLELIGGEQRLQAVLVAGSEVVALVVDLAHRVLTRLIGAGTHVAGHSRDALAHHAHETLAVTDDLVRLLGTGEILQTIVERRELDAVRTVEVRHGLKHRGVEPFDLHRRFEHACSSGGAIDAVPTGLVDGLVERLGPN